MVVMSGLDPLEAHSTNDVTIYNKTWSTIAWWNRTLSSCSYLIYLHYHRLYDCYESCVLRQMRIHEEMSEKRVTSAPSWTVRLDRSRVSACGLYDLLENTGIDESQETDFLDAWMEDFGCQLCMRISVERKCWLDIGSSPAKRCWVYELSWSHSHTIVERLEIEVDLLFTCMYWT